MRYIPFTQLSDEDRSLVSAAQDAIRLAYNPTTHHLMGAAVQTQSGEIIQAGSFFSFETGVNICAERGAIITANSLGKRDFAKLAIVNHFHGEEHHIVTPCGICRQFLYEVAQITNHDIPILIGEHSLSLDLMVTSVQELLPFPYPALVSSPIASSVP
ncbi:hypothetical protein HGA88_03350 [Candidatus Roizmanbacteria bacterium]|nr:hypothetical protein [Candidatus Roizmanbacteria bacterium]